MLLSVNGGHLHKWLVVKKDKVFLHYILAYFKENQKN